MPSPNPWEPKSFHESYSSGISLDKISTLQLLRKWEVNGRLYIKEVGVDLELCVHAHGHDVYPIMEASCNNNYSLDIISFGICELILCNRGSDHILSLIPFLGLVKALVFCRSMHPCNLYYVLPSSITPWYLDKITEPYYFFWVLLQVLFLTDFNFSLGSELLDTQGHR